MLVHPAGGCSPAGPAGNWREARERCFLLGAVPQGVGRTKKATHYFHDRIWFQCRHNYILPRLGALGPPTLRMVAEAHWAICVSHWAICVDWVPHDPTRKTKALEQTTVSANWNMRRRPRESNNTFGNRDRSGATMCWIINHDPQDHA